MNKLKDYMMNESSEFSPVENNPLVYLLLIPKILHGDVETIKKDPIVKNVVDLMEKFVKTLDKDVIKLLKTNYAPHALLDLFKLSKNYRETFDNYMTDMRSLVCNEEKNFMKCLALEKKFDELFASPEFVSYRNTL